MIILGVDPGYAIVGFGLVEYKNTRFMTLDYGAITTPPGIPMEQRLQMIYNDLCTVLQQYKPDAMSIEKLFFNNNQKTAIAVSQARGVILLAAVQHGVACYEYTPLQVKQSVVGYGQAVKSQVMEMTKRLLNLSKIPKPDDTADALAMAICHAHTAGSRMNIQNLGRSRL
ncbi:MAG TPA: crossover junction endodeoxyribonuclease RuvC [Firmicutes bacterium]|nr:crossover junction endodeoxyribonuclease RuvC [Bacillota bacterium]